MNRHLPTPIFVIAIIVLIVFFLALHACNAVMQKAQQAAIDRAASEVLTPAPRQDWRPDIRHCHAPDVDLWDCIRNDPR